MMTLGPIFPTPLRFFPSVVLAACLLFGCANSPSAPSGPVENYQVRLTPDQSAAIGRRIWVNECGGTVAGLTSWNRGEYFASLGIGHFIWYHPSRRGPFDESFPALLEYMKGRNVALPEWLATARGCPWATHEEFEADRNSTRMNQLRGMLVETIPVQTEFIVRRLEQALPKILATLPSDRERQIVRRNFHAVAETAQGVFALIDYVNFKGEGVVITERYQGEGWGLLQVLQEMRGAPRGAEATREFSAAAKRVLQRRVANSPPERNESQWLPGWTNRLDTYMRRET